MRPPNRRGARCLGGRVLSALAIVSAIVVLALPGGAQADTPAPASAISTTSSGSGLVALEAVASRIATHIAGRSVTVRCNAPNAWVRTILAVGGSPGAENGSVSTAWSETGALTSLATTAELNEARVCLALQRFAAATVKPTRCATATAAARGLTAATSATSCYLGSGRTAAAMSVAYWTRYGEYAIAILTLAHEAVHLSGVVGGKLPNGVLVGDPQAEAKADCYGMQWIPYVAEQLGDSAADAKAIAAYYRDTIYPQARHSGSGAYWSASCVPGGSLDLHLAAFPGWA